MPIVLLANAVLAAPASAWWTDQALRLTGESARVRAAAIRALRATPNLAAELREALESPERFLALDVIVALDWKAMVPDVARFAESDRSGYGYHALNALTPREDSPRLVARYLDRLANPELAPGVKMALLDSLARTSARIPPRDLDRLLADPFPEVRESALGYLRAAILRRGELDETKRVVRATGDPADAIRARARSILGEVRARSKRRPMRGGSG